MMRIRPAGSPQVGTVHNTSCTTTGRVRNAQSPECSSEVTNLRLEFLETPNETCVRAIRCY